MNAYGGPVCVGCGENEPAVLQLDHINGGGNQHALRLGNGNLSRGRSLVYKDLIDNGFPPGYRVLCPTCNIKAARGITLPAFLEGDAAVDRIEHHVNFLEAIWKQRAEV